MNKIVPLCAFQDNYIWTVHSLEGNEIIVVDPGDARPVLDYIEQHQLILHAILLTHHHWDHSGGIPELAKQFPNSLRYGPLNEKVEGITDFVQEGQTLSFPPFNLTLNVLDIPGHTLGHVAYYNDELLFSGDTLFSCGCGRVFEGTPQQMFDSLNKLKALDPNTQLYCGHEYTLANLEFAYQVDPSNHEVAKRIEVVKSLREQNTPSLPVSLKIELMTNPFLRCEEVSIRQAAEHSSSNPLNTPTEVFTRLRTWKNQGF